MEFSQTVLHGCHFTIPPTPKHAAYQPSVDCLVGWYCAAAEKHFLHRVAVYVDVFLSKCWSDNVIFMVNTVTLTTLALTPNVEKDRCLVGFYGPTAPLLC